MKKFTSIILLIVSLTTIFSFTAFAQETNQPTVKSVRALNSKEVKVFFEGNVNITDVENTANYQVYKYNSSTPIEVIDAAYNSEENTVTIKISTDLSAGTAYKLDMTNICSELVTYFFAGISPIQEVHVESVAAITNSKVKIVFSEAVNSSKALDEANYYIYNDDTIIDILEAEYNSYDHAVILTTASDLLVHTIYKLDIKNICSDGNVTKVFVGDDQPEVSINTIKKISNNEFKIIFAGEVEKAEAEDLANYSIYNQSTNMIDAKYNSSDNSVNLTIDTTELKPCRIYKLLISNICTDGTVNYLFAIAK